MAVIFTVFALLSQCGHALCQDQAPYDFAINTHGERYDELSPAAIAGLSFGVCATVAGLMVTILFCYYVRRKQKQHELASGSFLASRAGY